jgi:hypothetical protein
MSILQVVCLPLPSAGMSAKKTWRVTDFFCARVLYKPCFYESRGE